MESLLRCVDEIDASEQVSKLLKLTIVGCAEMAGRISRWDRWYLKSYEAMAGHRFNVTTLSVEPNVVGAGTFGRGTLAGRLKALEHAASWLHDKTGRSLRIQGPLPSTSRRTRFPERLDVRVALGPSARMVVPRGSIQIVLTDPPYHDDVSYHELSALFSSWASVAGLKTGKPGALRGGDAFSNHHEDYARMLTASFSEAKRALANDGRLILTFANRDPLAWLSLAKALKDSGFEVVGYSIVRAENEMDHVKRGTRACNMNLIVDSVPKSTAGTSRWKPRSTKRPSAEREFLGLVGNMLLNLGAQDEGWEARFVRELRTTRFLAEQK
jgi:adenine-specific DNA methylase